MSETHEKHLCDTCSQADYAEFQHACIHESMAQNEVWLEKYSIDSWPRWDYSMEASTLTFSENGSAKVICQMQVVGSTTSESWEWSWGNENFPIACRRLMSKVYEFGEVQGWGRLTTLFLEKDEYVGWECASVASHVLRGEAVYRCPSSDCDENDAVFVVVLSSEFVN